MSELENNNESNIDLLAEQFGIIMAQILCMKNDEWYDTLKVMGNSLGRFIYILDAYDDFWKIRRRADTMHSGRMRIIRILIYL